MQRPRRLSVLNQALIGMAVVAGALAIVTTIVVLRMPRTTCHDGCVRQCAGEPEGLRRTTCVRRCEVGCSVEAARERVTRRTGQARREVTRWSAPREERSVHVGDQDVHFPEFNVPGLRLAQAAMQLKAPLHPTLQAKAPRISLRREMVRRGVPIKQQWDTNACMAQALTSAMEFALVPTLTGNPRAKQLGLGRRVRLARKHAYWLSLHGAGLCHRNKTTGSWVLQAASAIHDEGTFEERYWPWAKWNPTSSKWTSCEEAVNGGSPPERGLAARHFKIDRYYYLPPISLGHAAARNPEHLEGILEQGHPIVFSAFVVDARWKAAARNGGHVRLPADGIAATKGAHYVLLTGYDRARRRFDFANSWGTRFGAGGYGTLSYDYVGRYGIEGLVVESMALASSTAE